MILQTILIMLNATLFALQSNDTSLPSKKIDVSVSQKTDQNPVNDFVPKALGMHLPIITSETQIDQYVGRVVAVRGIMIDKKNVTIAGVAIDPGDLRDQEAYAIGILSKFVYTKEAHEKSLEECRARGNLIGLAIGPGVYYTLYKDLDFHKAKAHPIPKR